MPIVAVATITPLPEHREAVQTALEESVPQVHREQGCQLYALHQSKDEFVLVEQWASADAMRAHGAGEPFRALNEALDGKLAGPLDLKILRPVPCGTPEQGRLVADG